MYMYVCMYICVYVYIYICIYIYKCTTVKMYVYKYICVCIYIYVYVNVYVCIHDCIINWADYITLDDAVRQLFVIRLQTAIYCIQLIPFVWY